MGQLVGHGPAAHGGRIDPDAQAAMDLGGGEMIGRGRTGREQPAEERSDACGPVRGVVAAGGAMSPAVFLMPCGRAEIAGVEFVEVGAAQNEPFSRSDGRDLVPAKSSEDYSDQRSAETAGDLTICF